MAGSLFGLGAGTPSRFPYEDRPQPAPGVGPGAGQPVRTRQVIVSGSGAGAGVFVYNGTPGLGTLVKSITSPSTATDPFGNAVIGTDTTYQKISPTSFQAIAYQGNEIQFFTATSPAGPWAGTGLFIFFSASGPTGILINAAGGTIQLAVTSTGVQVAGAAFTAGNGLSVTGGTTTDTETVTGALTATGGTPASPVAVKTDVWNAMGLAAGFTAGVPAPQFKLMPDQTVMCRGIVSLSANQVAGTVFATLGASYLAAHGTQFVTRNTLSGYALGNGSVANAGGASTLAIVVAGVTGNVVELDGVRYSTDT